MSFDGSRVGALRGPGTPLRPAGSRKNILEPGGRGGGGETGLPFFSYVLGEKTPTCLRTETVRHCLHMLSCTI